MIQEIIVYIIGAVVAIFLLTKVYKMFFAKKDRQGLDCSCNCNANRYGKSRNRAGF